MISKDMALPAALGALGIGYFAATYADRPPEDDTDAMVRWQRHARDAKIALAASLGAGLVLWLVRASPSDLAPSSHR